MYPHSLPIGAHLTTPRLGYVHHGLYAGSGRVIHSAGFKTFFRKGPVEDVPLEEFSAGRRWRIHSLPRNKAEGIARIERARSRLGEDAYRFWSNNCEHFVQWCISGERRSRQVERLAARALGAMAVVVGLVLAGCAAGQPSTSGGTLKPAASVERWWTHYGAAAAIERRIALTYEMQRLHEPF
jgi:hypothetical protein